ncbi:DUF4349 domain-containing protein [Protaetiibacter larvae]|uniref:DUF4349 domain-containing protein n=1 Tax=Protaetiibacter larvae TaxID=2592654 RepID=A0A5C1Y704_9MICO|nr:DUF4349 domain-containing protein [Protaetiibacter larvae]QEO09430.1 DUF4349 domain-containing protein [Protaetiibacter larvae]
MRHSIRIPVALAAALAASTLFAGCTASGASDIGETPQHAAAPPVMDGDTRFADAATGELASTARTDEALVVTGSITITADDPIAAAEKATTITTAAGGRIDSRQQYAPRGGDAGSATLTLRIPADALEKVRGELTELGRVDETLLGSENVTALQRDLETRITTLRTSIGRYTGWLATAVTTSDLIELEQAIAQRQSELESLEAQQRELADQVAMSTITLNLRSEALAPPPEGPKDVWSAIAVGWNAFLGFWASALIGIGVGLPWLVLLAAAAVVVLWQVRRGRRTGDGARNTGP